MLSFLLAHLVLAALATCQAVEVFHHGSLFAPARARAFRWSTCDGPRPLRLAGELLLCPFCLSHWVAAAMVILVGLGCLVSWVYALPVWWLAVTRGANLCNDLLHAWSRTPRDWDTAIPDATDTCEDGDDPASLSPPARA